MSYKSRKVVGALASVAVGVGLLGGGVYATLADSVAATDSVNVANGVACSLSTTDTNAVVNGNSITINVPEIQVWTGSYLHDVTVKNSGSGSVLVNWTATPQISMAGGGDIQNTLATSSPTMTNNITLAGGASQKYTSVGVKWESLQNQDEGATAQIVYTAHCSEAAESNVSFVSASSVSVNNGLQAEVTTGTNVATFQGAGTFTTGHQNGNGKILFSNYPAPYDLSVPTTAGSALVSCTAWNSGTGVFTGCTTTSGSGNLATGSVTIAPKNLPLPSGWQPGDLAVAMTVGDGVPTGFGQIPNAGTVQSTTKLSQHVRAAGDPSSFSIAAGNAAEIAIYRGTSGVGAFTSATINQQVALRCGALTLQKSDGSSLVGCMAHDSFATTNVNTMGFAGLTARVASPLDNHMGVADTNSGVSAFSGASWLGNWGASHSAEAYSFELLSQ